jgi:hypothetical protein
VAITNSGLYLTTWVDIVDATQLPIDLTLTSHKVSLINNTHTPNFDTDSSWNSTNEVFGTGWPTGGVALSAAAAGATSTVPTVTISPSGTLMWDMNDIAVSGTTLSNAQAMRIYADALAGDNLIILVNFGGAFSTSNGVFGVQLASAGLAAVDLTP